MKRRGFTLIEVAIASLITTVVAGAVIGTIRAITESTYALDIAAQAMARVARADARFADHANRARMIWIKAHWKFFCGFQLNHSLLARPTRVTTTLFRAMNWRGMS